MTVNFFRSQFVSRVEAPDNLASYLSCGRRFQRRLYIGLRSLPQCRRALQARSGALLQNNHFAQERHIVRLQLIEIETTRNALADCIASIPMCGAASVDVVAFPLMA